MRLRTIAARFTLVGFVAGLVLWPSSTTAQFPDDCDPIGPDEYLLNFEVKDLDFYQLDFLQLGAGADFSIRRFGPNDRRLVIRPNAANSGGIALIPRVVSGPFRHEVTFSFPPDGDALVVTSMDGCVPAEETRIGRGGHMSEPEETRQDQCEPDGTFDAIIAERVARLKGKALLRLPDENGVRATAEADSDGPLTLAIEDDQNGKRTMTVENEQGETLLEHVRNRPRDQRWTGGFGAVGISPGQRISVTALGRRVTRSTPRTSRLFPEGVNGAAETALLQEIEKATRFVNEAIRALIIRDPVDGEIGKRFLRQARRRLQAALDVLNSPLVLQDSTDPVSLGNSIAAAAAKLETAESEIDNAEGGNFTLAAIAAGEARDSMHGAELPARGWEPTVVDPLEELIALCKIGQ